MVRAIIAAIAGVALCAATAGGVLADKGEPGTTFPEQPGTRLAGGCSAVIAHTGTGAAQMSATAGAITTGLLIDACFGG